MLEKASFYFRDVRLLYHPGFELCLGYGREGGYRLDQAENKGGRESTSHHYSGRSCLFLGCEDEIRQRPHRSERRLCCFFIRDHDFELFLDQHNEFECIDRVQSKAIAEDGLRLDDLGRRDLQTKPLYQ